MFRYGHQSAITSVDALARERAITSGGSDCSIRIWKIVEESQLVYNGHRGNIETVKLINEENFLSSGDDGYVQWPLAVSLFTDTFRIGFLFLDHFVYGVP